MSGIFVSVKPPTTVGRLHPRYDEESGILTVESKIQKAWPFGVDVDGALVFDLDEHRILVNFDLHIPKTRWKRNLEDDIAIIAPAGDLEFTQQAITRKSFHLNLRARCDQNARRLKIELGTAKPDRAVALSDSCIALLATFELVGFFIKNIQYK